MADDAPLLDLSLATVAELVDELRRRYDATLILGLRPSKVGDDGEFHLLYHGGVTQCIGMAERARSRLTNACNKQGDADDADGL